MTRSQTWSKIRTAHLAVQNKSWTDFKLTPNQCPKFCSTYSGTIILGCVAQNNIVSEILRSLQTDLHEIPVRCFPKMGVARKGYRVVSFIIPDIFTRTLICFTQIYVYHSFLASKNKILLVGKIKKRLHFIFKWKTEMQKQKGNQHQLKNKMGSRGQ